ncbi:c-type cytochrome [Bdellovibrio svalbardensis]|uniref:c-type cytochrome n=1 Tax=Bdellovibrio svalbardensis TaxID=2972972 RepID=UPI0038993CFB
MSFAKAPAPFQPPAEKDLPDNEFGRVVRFGRDVFIDTQKNAKPYIGNALNCVNCHLNAGRLVNSAPLWGAYVLYPAYRKKTNKVDTLASRIQGCFMYSMNGKAPAADSAEITGLVTYMYWLAKGAPTGTVLPGQGYLELKAPPRVPSWEAGQKVYEQNCALCHGANGEGQFAEGKTVFPPLWGSKSFNWGAGMHRINTAAGFIKANMPLGRGGMLTEQQAWDVAYFMNSHERPKDPRQTTSIDDAKKNFHAENCSYGNEVGGHKLGQGD